MTGICGIAVGFVPVQSAIKSFRLGPDWLERVCTSSIVFVPFQSSISAGSN